MKRSTERGFSLLELVVVIAIIAVVAAIAVPAFRQMGRRNELLAVTDALKEGLLTARTWARAGREFDAGGNVAPTRAAFVRIESGTSFSVWADQDTNPATTGNQTRIELVDLRDRFQGLQAAITAPAVGTNIRFGNDGRATGATIRIEDNGGSLKRVLEITGAGAIRSR